jgi:hypothetical protein
MRTRNPPSISGFEYEKHNYPTPTLLPSMADTISASERDRIIEFVNTPRYKRTPEQLLPKDADEAVSERRNA